MRTDTVILQEGIIALKEKLGLIDSEKFINLILREKFDYTVWQRSLWQDKTINKIHDEAEKYYNEKNK